MEYRYPTIPRTCFVIHKFEEFEPWSEYYLGAFVSVKLSESCADEFLAKSAFDIGARVATLMTIPLIGVHLRRPTRRQLMDTHAIQQ